MINDLTWHEPCADDWYSPEIWQVYLSLLDQGGDDLARLFLTMVKVLTLDHTLSGLFKPNPYPPGSTGGWSETAITRIYLDTIDCDSRDARLNLSSQLRQIRDTILSQGVCLDDPITPTETRRNPIMALHLGLAWSPCYRMIAAPLHRGIVYYHDSLICAGLRDQLLPRLNSLVTMMGTISLYLPTWLLSRSRLRHWGEYEFASKLLLHQVVDNLVMDGYSKRVARYYAEMMLLILHPHDTYQAGVCVVVPEHRQIDFLG